MPWLRASQPSLLGDRRAASGGTRSTRRRRCASCASRCPPRGTGPLRAPNQCAPLDCPPATRTPSLLRPLQPPLRIATPASRLDEWADEWALPEAPINRSAARAPPVEIELVPYGCAKVLKISMFPYLESA